MAKVRKIGYQVRRKPFRALEFVPELTLAGKWMLSAGFAIGQPVRVVVENGKITIEP
jgi:hypothetical protein